MQQRRGLPGALKTTNEYSAFRDPSGLQWPLAVEPLDNYVPVEEFRAIVHRVTWCVPVIPDAASTEFGVGMIVGFGATPDPLNAPYLIIRVIPGPAMEIIKRETSGGPVTILQDITSSFAGVDTLMQTEFWLFGRTGTTPARMEIYFGGGAAADLVFTVPEVDLPQQTAGDARYGYLTPFAGGGAAPQTVGQLWHGPSDYFSTPVDRDGRLL